MSLLVTEPGKVFEMRISTPYIRLVKFQLERQITDVDDSACVFASKIFLLYFSQNTYTSNGIILWRLYIFSISICRIIDDQSLQYIYDFIPLLSDKNNTAM